LKVWITSSSRNFFHNKLKQKYSGPDLESKIQKCTRGGFKIIYFSFTFILGMTQVLWKTDFAPPSLAGDGVFGTLFGDWPYIPKPYLLKFYYIVSLSYYVEDGIMHCLQKPNFDFWEMILHHTIACMLIFFSYVCGFWNFGILILVQMDISDVFIGAIRIFMDFVPTWVTVSIYLGILSSWAYFRFYVYFNLILWSFAFDARLIVDGSTECITVMNILLTTLFGLNVYWFVLLLMMGIRLIKIGKAQDLQMVVTKKEIED
jgi:hypothetical protein